MGASNSSLKSTSTLDRIREWFALAKLSLSDAGNRDFTSLRNSYAQHDAYARKYLGKPLSECRVVEVGYGARPNRLIWFAGMGADITGIDLDQPILYGSPAEFLGVWRRNGWERALKTVARWIVNERGLRKAMLTELSRVRGQDFPLPAERLAVGDAAGEAFWNAHSNINYIFSEDVFEHIPGASIDGLLARMAERMDPNGIAFVKPLVYTGICGGHHIEWYSGTLGSPRERVTEPWEHLRRNRHPANTYLNKLTLAQYREHFLRYFDILEETVTKPNQGREFLTPEVRAELSAWSEEELFSNTVLFILRPRRRS